MLDVLCNKLINLIISNTPGMKVTGSGELLSPH